MALNSLFSPNGFSVGNLFNPTNVVLANGDITAGNSVTANYFLGNGAFLSGIPVGNTTVSNTAPVSAQQGDVWIQANTGIQYIYFTSGGNSQWAEMEAVISISSSTGGNYGDSNVAAYLDSGTGNIVPAANVTYSLGNSTRQWANLWVSGNTIYIGGTPVGISNGQLTVSGNTVVSEGSTSAGNIETTGNITGAFFLGNIRYATGGYNDANVADYTGALANLTGNVITTANISGSYILGNGALLTGLASGSYSNANVANYLASGSVTSNIITSGNISGGNILLSGNLFDSGTTLQINTTTSANIIIAPNQTARITATTTGANVTGTLTATGNITGSNFNTTGLLSATGNVTGGIVIATNNGGGTNFRVGDDVWLGDINVADTMSIRGVSNAAQGFIVFGNADTTSTLGRAGTGNLTYTGNITATGNVIGGGFVLGYRDIPQVSWTSVTMALGDAGKHYYTSAGGVTLTVPSNANVAFPIGATVAFYNRSSANCTIAPQASVNIFVVGNSTITPTASRTITSNGGGTLTKVDTNTWMLSAANVF